MAAWIIATTVIGALVFVSILVGTSIWLENRERKNKWRQGK